MRPPLVLVSGFGAFEDVEENPSGQVARLLERSPPRGSRVVADVLPVSFRRAPEAWDRLWGRLADERPALLLALGVHPRPGFRLEGRARARLPRVGRPDVDGVDAVAGSSDAAGQPDERRTALDVDGLALLLNEAHPETVQPSWNAGGYVCERIYHHVLARAEREGLPALFVHVPRARFTPVSEQARRMRALVELVLARA